jgi:hypothetical protein
MLLEEVKIDHCFLRREQTILDEDELGPDFFCGLNANVVNSQAVTAKLSCFMLYTFFPYCWQMIVLLIGACCLRI